VDAGPVEPPFDAGYRTLLLTNVAYYSTSPDAGVGQQPPAGFVTASCPLPDGGTEERVSETVQPGLLRIEAVRAGRCTIGRPDGQLITAADSIGFNARVIGRPGAPLIAAGQVATLNLSLSGLSPWQAGDQVTLASLETGYLITYTPSMVTAGATQVAPSARYTYSAGATPGLAPGQGDRLLVLQSRLIATPTPHRVPVAANLGPAPAIIAAGTFSHAVTLQPAAPGTVELDHDFSEYVQQLTESNPEASLGATSFSISAQPAQPQLGLVRSSPTGSAFNLNLFAAAGRLLQGTYQLGAPVEGTTLWVSASQSSSVLLPVPQAGGLSFTLGHARTVPFSSFDKSLPAQLSPVRGLAVNGVEAFSPLVGTGTRPRITWELPRLGVPDSYRVSLYTTQVTAGAARAINLVSVRTFERSYTPPPGLLPAGQPYFVLVRALKGPAWRRDDEVFPASPEEEYADALSTVLVP
jgi:hypothetical protein